MLALLNLYTYKNACFSVKKFLYTTNTSCIHMTFHLMAMLNSPAHKLNHPKDSPAQPPTNRQPDFEAKKPHGPPSHSRPCGYKIATKSFKRRPKYQRCTIRLPRVSTKSVSKFKRCLPASVAQNTAQQKSQPNQHTQPHSTAITEATLFLWEQHDWLVPHERHASSQFVPRSV